MSSRAITLDQFIADYPFWGNWEVSYTDQTHLPPNEYVKLGDLAIGVDESAAHKPHLLPFTFRPATDEMISSALSSSFPPLPNPKKQRGQSRNIERAKRIIKDQLAESLVRSGLLPPKLQLLPGHHHSLSFQEVLSEIARLSFLILVVDTGAIRRGAISFLHQTLRDVSIWTVVPVFVMTEVQRQVAELNKIWRETSSSTEKQLGKCDVLKKRPQVSSISRELNYMRRWRPVEFLIPSEEDFRHFSVDRLIIESVKNLKRERGLHEGVYLITADKDVASLAALEAVEAIHTGVPSLPREISSIRYDVRKKTFIFSQVHYLLWDLTQVFTHIRLSNHEHNRQYELVYYSKARDGFFARDVLEIREQ